MYFLDVVCDLLDQTRNPVVQFKCRHKVNVELKGAVCSDVVLFPCICVVFSCLVN